MYIMKIWCKLCAKFKNQIINHPIIKGAAVNAVTAFADGTEVVTKFQVGLNFHVSLYAENKLISILNSE